VLAEADWIVDLSPEGGEGGGKIVAQGTPEQVARLARASHTGKALAAFFGSREGRSDRSATAAVGS